MATPKTLDLSKFKQVATPSGIVYLWYTDVQPFRGGGYSIVDPIRELSNLIGSLTRMGFVFTPAHLLRATFGAGYMDALNEEAAEVLGSHMPAGYVAHVGEFGSGLYPASIATFNYWH